MVLGVSNFLTPLDTQAPTPLIPLLITEGMGLHIDIVGRVFATLTVSSMCSFIMIMPLSKCLTPRAILLSMFTVRLVSGIAYFFALRENGDLTLPLIYVSRAIYGLSLNTFALPAIWIACRMPADERPKKVTQMQGALMLGIVLGPSWGATLAAFMPTDWAGYASCARSRMHARCPSMSM